MYSTMHLTFPEGINTKLRKIVCQCGGKTVQLFPGPLQGSGPEFLRNGGLHKMVGSD